MKASALYQPVQHDLELVNERLAAIAGVEWTTLSLLLNHILNTGGKRLRPALTLLAGKLWNYDPKLLLPMAAAVELLHTATLVHDDTIDNAALRRGTPTVNATWNRNTAILLGDYLFAKSADLVASTGSLRAIKLFANTLMMICDGELHQLYGAFSWDVSLDDYYRRIKCKTASLFRTATESGAILSGAPEESIAAIGEYGAKLGTAFQIVDDILDFTGDEGALGKPAGSDLSQGTVTLPAILFSQRHAHSNPLRELFARGWQEAVVAQAVEIIRNSDAIEEAYRVAEDFAYQAGEALASLPVSQCRDALLGLAEYVVRREH